MCKTSRRRCELHGTVYNCAIETIKTSSLFPSSLFIAVVFTLASRLSIWFHLSVWRQSDGLIITLSCNYLFFLSFPLAFSASLHSMVYIHFGVPPLRVRLCRCRRRGRHTYTKMPRLQRGEWKDVKGPLSRKKKRTEKEIGFANLHYYIIKTTFFFSFFWRLSASAIRTDPTGPPRSRL